MAEARQSQPPFANPIDGHPRYLILKNKPRMEAIYVNACRLPHVEEPSKEVEKFKRRALSAKRLIINCPKSMIYPRPFGGTDYPLIAYAGFPDEAAISFMDESRNNHYKQLIALGFTPEALATLSVLTRFVEVKLAGMPTQALGNPAAKALKAMRDSHDCLSGVNPAQATTRFFGLVSELESISFSSGIDALLHAASEFEVYSREIESVSSHPAFVASLRHSEEGEGAVLVFPTYLSSDSHESLLTNILNGVLGVKFEVPYWAQHVGTTKDEWSRGVLEAVSNFFGMDSK
ncbi:hypothetical protein JW721_00740 [Candidatus Micrarchaeota archaeon]|nr:hypothetical protein [Candidatus Micrarchaeota archaeon]